jgi:chemotaxis protein MotA
MEHGELKVLFQPAELVTIGGAAIGTVLIANPLYVLIQILKGVMGTFAGSKFHKQRYLDTLKMLFDLFNKARKDGLAAVEADIEEPEKSQVFAKFPVLMKDHHTRDFICDTLRTATAGAVEPFDIDQMMETDMDVHHHDSARPIAALGTMADALPGLGIVAAVLGIVVTMGALGGPPEEIGHKVAAALVGTFLGILLCYGLVGPITATMTKMSEDEHAYYHAIRVTLTAFVKGTPPILAVEMGRRAVPGHVRPTFKQLEELCRNKGGAAAAAA